MRAILRTVLAPGASAAVLAIATVQGGAWAQTATPTDRVTPSTPAPAATGSDGTVWLTIGLLVGLVVLVVLIGKLLDLRRRREAEALHVQAQISDALLREPGSFALPVTATAHAPLWRGSPMRVEITGRVPDEATREAILRIARQEARRVRPDVEVEHRLVIDREAALPRVA
jgi:hypothetical protein